MPIPTEEIITRGMNRLYVQKGGPRPDNVAGFAGIQGQHAQLTGLGNPEQGGIDPIWVPDPRFPKRYKLVGRQASPPDLPSATLELMEKRGPMPEAAFFRNCPFNVYVVSGICRDLSDFVGGWEFYVTVVSLAEVTEKDLGDRVSYDNDESVMDSLTLVPAGIYAVGKLGLGENAATTVTVEVVDAVYYSNAKCGTCGENDDGTQWIAALQKGDGYGTAPAVVYSTDGGGTWTSATITGTTGATSVQFIRVVGDKLIVGSKSATGYYWATINQLTGVPGAWTLVTTGFQSGGYANDCYVKSANSVWFCGDLGWIYEATSITAGVTARRTGGAGNANLNRIAGDSGEAIVAVGASATVLISLNSGRTFAAATNAPGASGLTALAVLDDRRFWVGDSAGAIYYTLTRGEAAWSQSTDAAPSATSIQDIVAATQEVLHVAYQVSGPVARVSSSWNGGRDWALSTDSNQRRLIGLPTFDKANRIAVPILTSDLSVQANNVCIAGLGGDGLDGIIVVGVASKL